jgi:hypothetical protein
MASRKDSVRPYTRTEQVQTTLTKEEREQLDARAAAEVVSRAEKIHRYILEGLERDRVRGWKESNADGFDVYEEIQRLKKELYG